MLHLIMPVAPSSQSTVAILRMILRFGQRRRAAYRIGDRAAEWLNRGASRSGSRGPRADCLLLASTAKTRTFRSRKGFVGRHCRTRTAAGAARSLISSCSVFPLGACTALLTGADAGNVRLRIDHDFGAMVANQADGSQCHSPDWLRSASWRRRLAVESFRMPSSQCGSICGTAASRALV